MDIILGHRNEDVLWTEKGRDFADQCRRDKAHIGIARETILNILKRKTQKDRKL